MSTPGSNGQAGKVRQRVRSDSLLEQRSAGELSQSR